MTSLIRVAIVSTVMVVILAPARMTWAQAPNGGALVASGLDDQGRLRLTPGKSAIITTRRPQKTIKVGEPSIVDVDGISPTRILATAKKTGTTQIIVWDDQDNSQSIDVVVTADIDGLREQLAKIFPNSKIEAAPSEDSIVLSGTMSSLEAAEQAAALAAPYGKSVINLIEITGNQQVMLQVRVAEVSRSVSTQLGVNFGFTDGTARFGSNVGQVAPFGFSEVGDAGGVELGIPTLLSSSVTLFGTGEIGQTAFAYFISALRDNNLIRILAEPNLVAISGQEASFLAGGEFPIPVPQSGTADSTTITIEFKEFGVRLNFVPIVLGDGRIRLKLAPEVSELDFSTAVRFSGFVVPGLTQRRVTTTVEMQDGQSLAIAGLLNQSISANKAVTPLLGDVPILGALFRSVRYSKKETELVILVTPRLVTPVASNRAGPLPGEHWRDPSELELFLNQDLGGPQDPTTQPSTHDRRRSPRNFVGSVGFAPATEPSSTE